MGSWKYNGIFYTWLEVDENGFTTSYGKSKPMGIDNIFHLTKKYFVHKTSNDLKKTVAFIAGMPLDTRYGAYFALSNECIPFLSMGTILLLGFHVAGGWPPLDPFQT